MASEAPSSGTAKRLTLGDYFAQFADLSAPYIEYDNGYRSWSYTYAQVGAAARGFAARLHAHGIAAGDKIIFWSENRPEWIAAFWGSVISGVIVVPVDYRASTDFLLRVEAKVQAKAILIGEEVLLSRSETGPPIWKLAEFDWSPTPAATPQVSLQPEDVAEIVFTSGSTGEPKGVLITHRNILSNLASPEAIIQKYVHWFRPVFPLRFLSLVPLSHMFGQALTMFLLPLIPGVAVFMRGHSPHEILRQIRTRHISVAVVVPKLLNVLRQSIQQQFPKASIEPSPGTHWTRRWWFYRKIHNHFGWKFWAFVVGAAPLDADTESFWTRLGFLVIQGYGLTETAPIVSFNNPFAVKKGTVGKPVEGTEIKIAEDGEVLVRGASVSPGYYGAEQETNAALSGGWLHTGDIGTIDETGRLTILGRKKEVIVTPEGLNVFPDDIERVLRAIPGVLDAAVVGHDHPHAVLVLSPAISSEEAVRQANAKLEEHQKIRGVSLWPQPHLPRTSGTEKLKRNEIQRWVDSGGALPAPPPSTGKESLVDIIRRYAPGREIGEDTTLDQLGLSSLDRVELMIDLEQHLDRSIDESALTGSQTLADLAHIAPAPETAAFPTWSRSWLARAIRRILLTVLLLPLTRVFAHMRVRGRENIAGLTGPVLFAPNHQSHMDTPVLLAALPARYRHRAGVAMWKEYFDAHFHPERYNRLASFANSLIYWIVTLFFNAFPLPQTEAGAGSSLRYLGDLISGGWSVLYFPEGERSVTGELLPFQPGIGLIAARLRVPVVPVRIRGLNRILPRGAHFPIPGQVEVTFGKPLYLRGEDYPELVSRLEEAIRDL
ncbi:MAG: AMP-binding protein [Bryobacteraceae bacterium]